MTDAGLDQIEDAFPLTPLQQGMLYHILSDPERNQYVGLITARIEGPLTQSAAQAAWETLLKRHEALRTAFLWEGVDQPMQAIYETAALDFRWVSDEAWMFHRDEMAAIDFDIAKAPLMQVRVVEEGPRQFRLIWAVHHLVADGWSAVVVLREFLELLNDEPLGEAPVFADHAAWLDEQSVEDDADFWRSYLTGHDPNSIATKGDGTGFGTVQSQMDADLLWALQQSAPRQNVTLNTVFQVGFAKAVGQLTGQNDVIFGLATSGRTSPVDGVADCVGLFVNTLPVRADLSQPKLAQSLEETGLALRAREHVAQADLARFSNTPPGQNLVDVVLSLRSLPQIPASGAFSIAEFSAQTPSNFPLTLEVDPNDGAINALYDRKVLSRTQVSDFVLAFLAALRADDADDAAAHRLLGPDFQHSPRDVLDRFLETVAAHPDRTAVTDEDRSLNFAALQDRSSAIAAYLSRQGVTPGDRVALVLPRNVDFVAAMLGTLMVGAAYVPIDSNYPAPRIAAILDDCDPRLTIGAGGQGDVDIASIPHGQSFEPVVCPAALPAYLIYTSGSTGIPKGVEISRGALAASQCARDQFYSEDPKAFLLLSPFAFDSSVVGLYWALTSGAHLVISKPKAEQDMAALGRLIARHSVTHTLMLPTLYQAMLEGAETVDLQSLRCVVVAGEPCPDTLSALHAAHLSNCQLANEYGPTEATVWATADLNAPGGSAPLTIGRPIAGMELFLLGPDASTVSTGGTGEIALAGPNLASGYFGRPEETALAFPEFTLEDGSKRRIYRTGDRGRILPDGRLAYLGRGDGQVKIRGHRIELAEAEAAIASLDGVRDVSVTVAPARPATDDDLKAALAALPEAEVAALIAKAGGSV